MAYSISEALSFMSTALERRGGTHVFHHSIEVDDRPALAILAPVRSSDGYFYASGSPNYQQAFFGRDSLKVVQDTLHLIPEKNIFEEVYPVVSALVRTQGTREDSQTDQEAGKIIHEWRSNEFEGGNITPHARNKLQELRSWSYAQPHEEVKEIRYYGSVDATPSFILLMADLCKKFPEAGKRLMETKLRHVEGHDVTVKENVDKALQWITRTIGKSPLTLFEYKRMSETGIAYPTWKDSSTGMIHPDGKLANTNDYIADTHLQGLAISALIKGADLTREFATSKKDLEQGQEYENLAFKVHKSALKYLWMEDYPALGLDRDENGMLRQIKTKTTGGMELLGTDFFDKRFWIGEEQERKRLIAGIVKETSSENFLTEAGPVCRSFEHSDLTEKMGYIDYHGPVVWPKNVKEVIDGLRKQGFHQLATSYSHLLRRSIRISQEIFGEKSRPELFYTDGTPHIIYKPVSKDDEGSNSDHFESIVATNIPEKVQTWSISAYTAEEHYAGQYEDKLPRYEEHWIRELDTYGACKLRKLMAGLPSVEEGAQRVVPVVIDIERGIKRETEYVNRFRPQSNER